MGTALPLQKLFGDDYASFFPNGLMKTEEELSIDFDKSYIRPDAAVELAKVIEVLKEYKIDSYADKKNIGIWVGKKNNSKKIAAIGIRVKRWVAYHGFALNVSNNLSHFKKIIPCGIKNKKVTSLKKLGIKNYHNIDNIITKKFLNIFL